MSHDDKCERWDHPYGAGHCRCEVRSLEAKLKKIGDIGEAYVKRADAAEAKLAEAISLGRICLDGTVTAEARLARLRPVVRAAVVLDDKSEWHVHVVAGLAGALNREVLALTPADIEWAKGGE